MRPESLTKKYSFRLCKLAFLIMFLLFSIDIAKAGERLILPHGEIPIPKDSYRTWSLFLINNPEWIMSESNKQIEDLYKRFLAFGDAIGPDHLAVWFRSTKDAPYRNRKYYKNIDVLRSSAFCSKLRLPPSKSPYVVITTEYPGEGLLSNYPETFTELKNYSVIELNNMNASEITPILNNLADQLVTEGLGNLDPKSEKYWRTLQRSFEATRDVIVGFTKKVKFRINTTFFSIELTP